MSKATILFLFGGESAEHDVSIESAHNVYAAIDQQAYSVLLCYIDVHGRWWHTEQIAKEPQKGAAVVPLLGEGAVRIDNQTIKVDVIYPALHGQNGEDGTLQGLAALMHVPIVGCGVDSSALCMNKMLTKKLLAQAGLPVVPGEVHYAGTPMPAFAHVAAKLGNTLFVKPARQGSSVGVSRVTSDAELSQALQQALRYDDIILIEAGLTVREIEVAVFGSTTNPQVSIVGEIVPDREFYSYESKYDADSTSTVHIPAKLPEGITEKIRTMAAQAFTELNCRGLARVDFFVDDHENVFINEINTLPGFTNISMYPKLWEASGKSTPQLVTELIELARS
jgi:D-alanine-D-alanine ligase